MSLTSDQIEEAERFKSQANEFIKEGKHGQAIPLYDSAININPNNAIYFANRSFAELKCEQYGAALEDADKAIELDPDYTKALYRRGSALLALGKFKDALKTFKQVVRKQPNSKEAREKLKQCEKIIKRLAFESAIEVKEEIASETIDISSIEIESSYDGPHMPEPITIEFVKELLKHLRAQKKLHIKYAYQILLKVKDILKNEPTLVEYTVPEAGKFNVCGDVHGQFYDFLNIFEINGLPSETNPYLFNGDFVDRGSFSVEVILSLFAMKILYPRHLHLNRGNHESITMNKMYGFSGEVIHKYNSKMFDLFTEVFNYLPLAALLNKKVLVVHGGLFSKDDVTIDDIRKIDRNRQPPDSGLMCELLWSDPQPFNGRAPSKRGVGIAFGPDVTHHFLKYNNLDLVIRSHEVKEEGYLVEAEGKLITVFSAPNYCDSVGNKGAIIVFDASMKPTFKQFSAVPHPDIKPMAYATTFGLYQAKQNCDNLK